VYSFYHRNITYPKILNNSMALKRPPPDAEQPPPTFFKSGTIEDRKSHFTGCFSPNTAAKQLQSLPEFKSATHKIAAWRHLSKQPTLGGSRPFDVGSDDDGEQWAGKKLENVLIDENVVGALVVARWYGGVMLGPARFRWIEQVAREAIHAFKDAEKEGETQSKRVKVDAAPDSVAPREIARQKERLVRELEQRDQNIQALRALLEEKKAKLEAVSPKPASPMKVVDYVPMSLVRLQALDKARDASVAYLLKQLDEIDKRLEEELELDEAFQAIEEQTGKKREEKADENQFGEEKALEEAWKDFDNAVHERPK
jgi:putative IMPACT (imprinted ancient) family translation regulator